MIADARMPTDREIVIARLIDAPRTRVFDAWTDPQQVVQWWGPRGFTTTTHKMEVRPGGVWRFVMHGPDGRDYQNKIVFIEVLKPERLVYRHAGEDEIAVPSQKAREISYILWIRDKQIGEVQIGHDAAQALKAGGIRRFGG